LLNSFPEIIRALRKEKGATLSVVSAFLNMDQAILSKIERGLRIATRKQVVKLAEYYCINEKEMIIAWLSDKLIYEIENEDTALNILQAAEEKVAYKLFVKIERKDILKQIFQILERFPKVQKAWIYGSFSREDDKPESDIDIAVKTDEGFSYFDLAEIQYQIEKGIKRKTDIGFIDSFKPYIFANLKPDLKLIYERSSY